jgi:hypothetical protein
MIFIFVCFDTDDLRFRDYMRHYHIPVVIIPAEPPHSTTIRVCRPAVSNRLPVEFYARPVEVVPGMSIPVPKPDQSCNCLNKNSVIWRKSTISWEAPKHHLKTATNYSLILEACTGSVAGKTKTMLMKTAKMIVTALQKYPTLGPSLNTRSRGRKTSERLCHISRPAGMAKEA